MIQKRFHNIPAKPLKNKIRLNGEDDWTYAVGRKFIRVRNPEGSNTWLFEFADILTGDELLKATGRYQCDGYYVDCEVGQCPKCKWHGIKPSQIRDWLHDSLGVLRRKNFQYDSEK